jgi:PIN domain nuclease of toxin-antitoxin system
LKVLLDTHTLIWAISEPDKLSGVVRSLIADSKNDVLVSTASAWEIAIKTRLGKLDGKELLLNFDKYMKKARFALLPIVTKHAILAGSIDGPHRDPFDRMLIAQSILESAAVLSNDVIFDQYQAKRIWN